MIRGWRWLGLVLLVPATLWASTPVSLDWDHLIPESWDPEKEVAGLIDRINQAQDGTEEAWEIMMEIQEIWQAAPLQNELDGTAIRLRGFVVPLEGDADYVRSYLLVPYFGACIHAPPPPRNQMLLVDHPGRGLALDSLEQVVEVTGVLRVNPTEMDYGQAGYTMETDQVEFIDGWF